MRWRVTHPRTSRIHSLSQGPAVGPRVGCVPVAHRTAAVCVRMRVCVCACVCMCMCVCVCKCVGPVAHLAAAGVVGEEQHVEARVRRRQLHTVRPLPPTRRLTRRPGAPARDESRRDSGSRACPPDAHPRLPHPADVGRGPTWSSRPPPRAAVGHGDVTATSRRRKCVGLRATGTGARRIAAGAASQHGQAGGRAGREEKRGTGGAGGGAGGGGRGVAGDLALDDEAQLRQPPDGRPAGPNP